MGPMRGYTDGWQVWDKIGDSTWMFEVDDDLPKMRKLFEQMEARATRTRRPLK